MSRGPGRIERAIADTFVANPTRIFTVERLAAIAYRGANRIDKKHRVGTIRQQTRLLNAYGGHAAWPECQPGR